MNSVVIDQAVIAIGKQRRRISSLASSAYPKIPKARNSVTNTLDGYERFFGDFRRILKPGTQRIPGLTLRLLKANHDNKMIYVQNL